MEDENVQQYIHCAKQMHKQTKSPETGQEGEMRMNKIHKYGEAAIAQQAGSESGS